MLSGMRKAEGKSYTQTCTHTSIVVELVVYLIDFISYLQGSKQRDIPKGFLFNLVSCPNYTFEVLSWVGFSVMTQIPFAYLFTLIGFIQMADWAKKKHRVKYIFILKKLKKLIFILYCIFHIVILIGIFEKLRGV
jgi:hypothetical protein